MYIYMWNNWTGWKLIVCSNRNKVAGRLAGNATSKLCTSQATKIGLVNCSTEPLEAHWDEEMANK